MLAAATAGGLGVGNPGAEGLAGLRGLEGKIVGGADLGKVVHLAAEARVGKRGVHGGSIDRVRSAGGWAHARLCYCAASLAIARPKGTWVHPMADPARPSAHVRRRCPLLPLNLERT